MNFLYPLCSSSKGNCTYIGNRESGIIIDVGLSLKLFLHQLDLINISISAIKGIFITHEHSDHISGLKAIGNHINVPIYASLEVIEHLVKLNKTPTYCKLYEMNNKPIVIDDMQLNSFKTPHDSVGSQCYKLNFSNGKNVAVCTDLGNVTQDVFDNIIYSDIMFMESNYDLKMLEYGSYPRFLKNRISCSKGHLSNEETSKVLAQLFINGTNQFILGHLSEENNNPSLAYNTSVEEIYNQGGKIDRDYSLSIAPKIGLGKIFTI